MERIARRVRRRSPARLRARVSPMTEFNADGPSSPDESLSPKQASSDAADLRAGISDLAGVVAGSLGLPELLATAAAVAVHAIPGADCAGATAAARCGDAPWTRPHVDRARSR